MPTAPRTPFPMRTGDFRNNAPPARSPWNDDGILVIFQLKNEGCFFRILCTGNACASFWFLNIFHEFKVNVQSAGVINLGKKKTVSLLTHQYGKDSDVSSLFTKVPNTVTTGRGFCVMNKSSCQAKRSLCGVGSLPTFRGRTQYAESASVGLNSSAGFSRRRMWENIYWWSLVINSSIWRDSVKPAFFSSMDMVTSPERVYTGKCGILAQRKTSAHG